MNISLDVDGVLADFIKSFKSVVNRLWPNRLEWDYQPSDWNFTDKLTKEEMKQAWVATMRVQDLWQWQSPLIGARELSLFVNRLCAAGINIYFLTNRPATSGATPLVQTNSWLRQHNLLWQDNASTIVVNKHDDKRKFIELLDIKFSLDDKPETVEDCSYIPGHKAFILDQPWNRDAKHLARVYNVTEYLHIALRSY